MMHHAHRNVFTLAASQALVQVVSVIIMTIGGLAGAQLATSPRWATLPIATMFLGIAATLFPASLWMVRVGRRIGFITGALLGAAGGAVATLAMQQHSLALLCVGTFLAGVYQGFAQFYRFAASEAVDEASRPRAISLVLAGGVVAAVIGPQLARLGGSWFVPPYLGSFLILAIVALVAALVLLPLSGHATQRRSRASPAQTPGRPWLVIVRQPRYLVALFAALTGYGVMILAMTATPIAMLQHQHGLGAAATVIELHMLGMYLPSFFTGNLITRVGVIPVMLAGVALLTGHVIVALGSTRFVSFASALVLLGVGWNFLYVGGTTLLTRTYTSSEAAKAQATNDMAIFTVGVACSLGAGALLDLLGWRGLNGVLLPWLAVTVLALLWLARRKE